MFSYSQNKTHTSVIHSLLQQNDVEDVWVYEYDQLVHTNESLQLWSKEITSPYRRSRLYFIDDEPFANWQHPCRYIYVNADNENDITVFNEETPPLELDNFVLLTEVNIPQGQIYQFEQFREAQTQDVSLFRAPIDGSSATYGKKYAVIISGGGNMSNNHERYWNDCSAIFSTLKYLYKFDDVNIYPLISDGLDPANDMRLIGGGYANSPTDLDGDGRVDVIGPATKAQITALFNRLSTTLQPEDFLYIFTTDHGGHNGTQSTMVLWNNEQMTAQEFTTEVNKVQANKISIVMEQCYSGGFIRYLTKTNRVIATACTETQLSYATRDLKYNEFVYHWTAAALGQYPNGTRVNADYNGDGFVSMQEAFRYANEKDTCNETPMYNSQPSTLGTELTLFGFEINSTHKGITVTANQKKNYYAYNLAASASGSTFIVNSLGEANLKAGNSIVLNPGFEVKSGGLLNALVEKFTIPVYSRSSPARGNIEINLDQFMEETTTISAEEMGEATANIRIYPTISKGVFYITDNNYSIDEHVVFELYSSNGDLILKDNISSAEWAVDIADQPNGLYLLNIYINGKVMTHKIIKQ